MHVLKRRVNPTEAGRSGERAGADEHFAVASS